MTVTETEIKEIAVQLANVAIVNYNDKNLTGAERKANVCAFLATLDDGVFPLNFVPNMLEAKILEIGSDNLKEFYNDDIEPFVEKCFGRIKHILHIG